MQSICDQALTLDEVSSQFLIMKPMPGCVRIRIETTIGFAIWDLPGLAAT